MLTVDSYRVLLLPSVIEFTDFPGLVSYSYINKYCKESIELRSDDFAYWRVMCTAFSFYYGLYSTSIPLALVNNNNNPIHVEYKRHFFNELWATRNKWAALNSETHSSPQQKYKIKVACRFRPGVRGTDKLCLPLHQFLKVKRQQRLAALEDTNNGSQLFVGAYDPEEFVDPILNSLMREPVLLTSSGGIVDRSVALQCILRGGRDPFNNEKLTPAMLVPQPELAAQIQEWRAKKDSKNDVAVEMKEVRSLMDENSINHDLMEALIEVERINAEVKRTKFDIANPNLAHNVDGEEMAEVHQEHVNIVPAGGNDDESDSDGDELDLPAAPNAIGNAAANAENWPPGNSISDNANENSTKKNKKAETARIIDINEQARSVSMHVPGLGVRPFNYATVFDGLSDQVKVFNQSASDSISSVLNGFNSCILCYGQTGAGKTYTFFGPENEEGEVDFTVREEDGSMANTAGIVMRTCQQLLQARKCMADNGITVSFTAQFVEIYEEQVIDLLTGKVASIRRENGEIVGALEASIDSLQQVTETLRTGHARKRFAATEMNDRSSRSHTAFVIQVLQKLNPDTIASFSNVSSIISDVTNDKLLKSQLHLVDLAGSERVKKSKATGTTLKEAVGINSSLLVLGKVIAALVNVQHHVPYYESKLTTLLKAAFGGNSRTTAIINCRTDDTHGDETLQSMRFGERCGMISNSMRQAASSFQATLQTIDKALILVQEQICNLESRGKQHLASYKNLVGSCHDLTRKRAELVAINNKTPIIEPKSTASASVKRPVLSQKKVIEKKKEEVAVSIADSLTDADMDDF